MAVAVALILSWGGAQRLDAQLVPGGLRDFASPAHLWLEGRVWRSADGVTSVPRLVVHAACDPYYFDAEEVETTSGRGRLFLCEANLPGLCGEFRLTVTSGPLLAARPQKWHKKRPDECSVWKEQLRHFFDPRYNSVAILEKWAQFDRLSTATVASYDLRTGRRIFVFGPDGVLLEKRAIGNASDGPTVEGTLQFRDIASTPFFPRTIVHLRRDSTTSRCEVTRWEFSHIEELADPEALLAKCGWTGQRSPRAPSERTTVPLSVSECSTSVAASDGTTSAP